MRYEKLSVDIVDRDFLDFTSGQFEGNVVLYGDEELIHILNEIRLEQGNTDLVGLDYDNEVYYNFYLMFNTQKQEVSIQGVCNHGKKDDEVCVRSEGGRQDQEYRCSSQYLQRARA